VVMLAGAAIVPAQQPGWTLVGFRVTAQANSFQSTFLDAVEKSSAAGVKSIEGYSGQKAGPDIPRDFDWNLTDADISAVRQKLRASGVTMSTYYAADFPADDAGVRKLLQFAKK